MTVMKRLLVFVCLVLLGSAGRAQDPAAPSLVITNARIIDGSGSVIERGAIAVRGGTIVSLSHGTTGPSGVRTIDAHGMTVMPGFIDAHRHVIRGNPEQWLDTEAPQRMQEYLDAGFTTVLSAGDPLEQILDLRKRLEQGRIKGPRLIVSGRVPVARGGPAPGPGVDPARSDRSRAPRTQTATAIPVEETRATIASLAKAGVDAIKTNIIVTPGGPEKEALKLVVSEGKKHGLPTITHAVTVQDTLAAVEAGVASLVHTPHIGRLDEDAAAVQTIAKAGIPMMSTLAIFVPHFDDANQPMFRDRQPFPWSTISSGGQGPVNARLLWEAGITYGYGTDTSWLPRESLADEVRALALMFSPRDIVRILTKNAAATILRGDERGTLEPGKLADIVILTGNPLENTANLLNVAMVIKGGEIVVDRR
jgi:enamidase